MRKRYLGIAIIFLMPYVASAGKPHHVEPMPKGQQEALHAKARNAIANADSNKITKQEKMPKTFDRKRAPRKKRLDSIGE